MDVLSFTMAYHTSKALRLFFRLSSQPSPRVRRRTILYTTATQHYTGPSHLRPIRATHRPLPIPVVIMPIGEERCSMCRARKYGAPGFETIKVSCPKNTQCHTCTWPQGVLMICCGRSSCRNGYGTCPVCNGRGSKSESRLCRARTHIH